jgi:hypothetical protein
MVLAQKEDQCIKIEDSDINPLIHSNLIFDKGAQIYNGEKAPSSTDVARKSGYPHV